LQEELARKSSEPLRVEASSPREIPPHLHDDDAITDDSFPDLSLKEKLMRLEMENRRLKDGADSASGVQSIQELENQLDDSRRLNAKYSKENAELQRKIRELESTQSLLDKSTEEEQQQLSKSADLEMKVKALTEKLSTLSSEKTKLEAYLRTAKTMLRTEREKAKEMVEKECLNIQKQYEDLVESLKHQIRERDKEIDFQKRLLEESKELSGREQKLMSSALYELGLELQRLKIPKPELPGVQTTPKSFLSQKRSVIEKLI